MSKYTIVSLFSGAGGLDLGFIQTGKYEILFANEKSESAAKTYSMNIGLKPAKCDNDERVEALKGFVLACDVARVDFASLKAYEIDISLEDLFEFYRNYKNNEISQFYVAKSDIEKYNLVEAIVTNPLKIFPPRLDKLFIYKDVIRYKLLSNKELSKCEVISDTPNLKCSVENTTVLLEYNLTGKYFFNKIFTGKVAITSGEIPREQETVYVDTIWRVYNFNYRDKWTLMMPAWVAFILYSVAGIYVLYLLIKCSKLIIKLVMSKFK